MGERLGTAEPQEALGERRVILSATPAMMREIPPVLRANNTHSSSGDVTQSMRSRCAGGARGLGSRGRPLREDRCRP